MKKSSVIRIGILIVLSWVIGFVVGIIVDYPKPEENELAGTIGRMGNYRNVRVSEGDIQLRSDLLSDNLMLKSYTHYYAFHYAESAKMSKLAEDALNTASNFPEFHEKYSAEINSFNQYVQVLKNARNDILLALTVLQNISKANEGGIGTILNNANVAIAKIKSKDMTVIGFIEALADFIKEKRPEKIAELEKIHDELTVNMVAIAAITNNKPVTKYFDQKEMFGMVYGGGSNADINVIKGCLNEDIPNIKTDITESSITESSITESSITESNVFKNIGEQFEAIIQVENNITQSGITQSEITQSEITQSGITQSEITQSEITQSNVLRTDIHQSGGNLFENVHQNYTQIQQNVDNMNNSSAVLSNPN
ncbi:MAG TPA: hypothetical protein PLK12_16600 [Prolixibacteraceae bacterium]|nr:hypothetical protein [Prolixibacteraceae bacterium]